MNKIILGFTFVLLSFVSLMAQDILEQGTITMKVTNATANDPQMAMMANGMVGSESVLRFNKEMYLNSMNIMGGMFVIETLVNQKDKGLNMLINGFGNKVWVESTLEDRLNSEQKQIIGLTEIKYDKNDTKDILGYKCYKMTLENPELPDVTIEAYITEDIKTKANLIQGFETLDLDGYHMEIIIKNKSFTIQMEATKIDKMLDESLFALNTKGYQKLSMQELMEKFKAFGM